MMAFVSLVRVVGVLFLAFSGSLHAIDDKVCVRNFYFSDNDSPCHRRVNGYDFVLHLDNPDIRICARVAFSALCASSPREYRWVRGESQPRVCTVDYNQPSVVNYCQTTPAQFDYAQPVP